VKNPVLGDAIAAPPDNASGADNQQERFTIESVAPEIGHFLAGFVHGEGCFMIVCRPRADHRRGWKISAAFNASQKDIVPLELLQRTFGCGTIRRAANGGWYYEVNSLSDINRVVIPFFTRFPMLGQKASDFALFEQAVKLMSAGLDDETYVQVLQLRDHLNGGGKRRYTMEKILRDYTPNPGALPVQG
jgi:hypothetical protein